MHRYKITLVSITLAIILLAAVLALSKTASAKLNVDSHPSDLVVNQLSTIGALGVGNSVGNDISIGVANSMMTGVKNGATTEAALLTGANQGRPLDIALDYINNQTDQLGLLPADLSDILVTDQYVSKHTGVTHIYLRQRYNDIEIINANININIASDGAVINLGSSFVSDLEGAVNGTVPILDPGEAVRLSAESVGLTFASPPVLEENSAGAGESLMFGGGAVSKEPIPVKLVYEALDDGLHLAWNVEIYEQSGDHWWSARVDALDGAILSQYDRVLHDQWGAIPDADANITADVEQLDINQFQLGATDALSGTYLVYALPDESPIHSNGRSLVINPAHQTASPFGWHDVDGLEGPDFPITRGNNVYAYTDLDGNNNTPGSSPDGGGGLVFSYTLSLANAPSTYRPAAVTNLFYWNNIMHDVSYLYGFDEEAGNFQENNYGNGGEGSDSVNAEAQDGDGFNKANFLTPEDGDNPVMQMFIWTATTPDRDADLDNGVIAHEYGHGISIRLIGGPTTSCLNNVEQMGEGWSDWQTIIMTMKPGGNGQVGKGIATYVRGENANGPGLRPAPYSTDLNINGYTYEDIATMSIPHGVGFIWNTMLWEMLWALIDMRGFNPDIYGDWQSGGNNLAHQPVIDGMKLTSCTPGFVDARNAILQADQVLTGRENQCTIWKPFAKRGLGQSAIQGSNNVSDETEAYDIPSACSLDIEVTPVGLESEVFSDVIDLHNLTIHNHGTGNLDWLVQESTSLNLIADNSTGQNLSGSPINLAFSLDDGAAENSIGRINKGQFIWLNRFTPNVEEFPLVLHEIWVQFSQKATLNGEIEIFIFEDDYKNDDPGSSAILLAQIVDTVQHDDGLTWSKFELNSAVSVKRPRDIFVGVVNRYAPTAIADHPASIDTTSTQQRSWLGIYTDTIAHVPENPTLPANVWGTIEDLTTNVSGNWMIRAYGYRSCTNLSDISWLSVSPSSGTVAEASEQVVEISFDSTGLVLGDYNSTLCIASSDISSPLITVPVTLTVVPRPEPPIAVQDSYTVTEDTVLNVAPPGVLKNDSGGSSSLSAAIDSETLSGTIQLSEDGGFIYTPTPDFNGIDSFTYRAFDGFNSSASATVTLEVSPINDAPVSESDSYNLNGEPLLDTPKPGVLSNDTDVEDDKLTALVESDPNNGDLLLRLDGSFVYTPTTGFEGEDSFQYRAFDGTAKSNIAQVKLNVIRTEWEVLIPFLGRDFHIEE